MSTTTRHPITRDLCRATLFAALCAMPSLAVAQMTSTPNADAERLERLADTIASTPKSYRAVATLYRRAAEVRGIDAMAAEDFRHAGWSYVAAHDLNRARQMMHRASRISLELGDVERAANSCIDEALIAYEQGRVDLVPALVARTHVLAGSPALQPDRRNAILERIDRQILLAYANTSR